MNNQDEQRALWREALAEDADTLWRAFEERPAPPARIRLAHDSQGRRWRLTAIAASLLAGISLLWSFHLDSELKAAHDAHALALLQTGASPAQLTAMAQLGHGRLSEAGINALKGIVMMARDPNVQLAALDLLLSNGALGDDPAAADLFKRVRHNRDFIYASLRARSSRI